MILLQKIQMRYQNMKKYKKIKKNSEEESIMETQDLNADPNSPVQSPDNIYNNTGVTDEKLHILQSLERHANTS